MYCVALIADWRALARITGVAACCAAIEMASYRLSAGWAVTPLTEVECRDSAPICPDLARVDGPNRD